MRNKRAVFVSSKNRADKFRQLVPKRRRYSSPAPRAGFRLQIYRVIPDAAYILGHFFSAASFQLWIPRLTLLSLTGGRLSNLSDRGKNMLASRGFVVFFFFLFFYSRFSIRVFRIFIRSAQRHMHRLHANHRHPEYQVAPAITMASTLTVSRIKTFRLITSRVILSFFCFVKNNSLKMYLECPSFLVRKSNASHVI